MTAPIETTSAAASGASFVDAIEASLPYLRRYARALTGSQTAGDAFAAMTLEALLMDGGDDGSGLAPRVRLFQAFHKVWSSAGAPVSEGATEAGGDAGTGLAARAQRHMAGLTPNTREALLLHVIEGFPIEDVAAIMLVEPSEAEDWIAIARAEMDKSTTGDILVIEDEAIIAMDLVAIVNDCGHRTTAIARTRDEAVRHAAAQKPDLILADIQLADNSSGIDAVNDILAQFGEIPVIFITAFPERLLTGKRPEPAFLMTKPYTEDQVRSAISQAMFFASTETLNR